eukprot:TRINITY_DN13654_c0_g1_i1.p1 TRINITY_DN13654_c0_g1~~TRINITY_DN13654_c0_g1_i1.p1  ORF type:complete len:532 (+),score=123.67 TRINITY_DN13654_c0_g1_i1:35-1597(+)
MALRPGSLQLPSHGIGGGGVAAPLGAGLLGALSGGRAHDAVAGALPPPPGDLCDTEQYLGKVVEQLSALRHLDLSRDLAARGHVAGGLQAQSKPPPAAIAASAVPKAAAFEAATSAAVLAAPMPAEPSVLAAVSPTPPGLVKPTLGEVDYAGADVARVAAVVAGAKSAVSPASPAAVAAAAAVAGAPLAHMPRNAGGPTTLEFLLSGPPTMELRRNVLEVRKAYGDDLRRQAEEDCARRRQGGFPLRPGERPSHAGSADGAAAAASERRGVRDGIAASDPVAVGAAGLDFGGGLSSAAQARQAYGAELRKQIDADRRRRQDQHLENRLPMSPVSAGSVAVAPPTPSCRQEMLAYGEALRQQATEDRLRRLDGTIFTRGPQQCDPSSPSSAGIPQRGLEALRPAPLSAAVSPTSVAAVGPAAASPSAAASPAAAAWSSRQAEEALRRRQYGEQLRQQMEMDRFRRLASPLAAEPQRLLPLRADAAFSPCGAGAAAAGALGGARGVSASPLAAAAAAALLQR